ncbi:MAG: hypothetical protein K2Y32_20815 [Candidatus Obscuribacterales bacterium]|nr:hypothetical protein [Candidatus Obscuribacterales bacterium]
MGRFFRLAAYLVSTLALFFNCASVGVFAAPQEWLLEQKQESNYLKVWLTEKAIAIATEPMGCHFVVKAPDYRVHCFRPKEKVEWVGEIANFNSIVLTSPWASIDPQQERRKMAKEALSKRVKVGESMICGLKCSKYVVRNTESYACDDISVAEPILDFYKRLVFSPRLGSLPLRCYSYTRGQDLKRLPKSMSFQIDDSMLADLRSGKLLKLDTTSCKKIPYNPKDFEVPAGLKRKVDLIEVSYSPGQRDQIESMMDNIVFESKVGRESSQNRSSGKSGGAATSRMSGGSDSGKK